MSLLSRIERGQTDSSDGGESGSSRLGALQSRRVAPPDGDNQRDTYMDLKTRVQNRLLLELDPSTDVTQVESVRNTIRDLFEQILAEESIVLSRQEKHRLFEQIAAEILGFGPLQNLLKDQDITEVMVNGPKNIYIEKKGKLKRVPLSFESDEHVMRIIDRIVAPLGRRIDESSPYVDARLPDGSRVNAVIPPISLVGPTLTIRKFPENPITIEQLVEFGSITPGALQFLKACVEARLNIVISGGTGSGKTTLLNIMSQFIPSDERIITIENAAELRLRQEHVIPLESRPPNIEGTGEITIRQLVVNSLRMRPDRIIVGEIRDEESLDMLQAMNTGHDGSMTTAHSNSPRDTLARIETMALMAGMELPVRAIREQIASAIDLVVHQERFRDGSRKVTNITEIVGMEGDVITMTDIYKYEQRGIDKGVVIGELRPTGLRPKALGQIEAAGIHLPPSVFGVSSRR
jgi:pilus assembly protein CpaF